MNHQQQMSPIGMTTARTTSSSTGAGKKRRFTALLGIQAIAAASYLLLASPSDTAIADQGRSRSLMTPRSSRSSPSSSSSSSSSSKDWITWPTVQSAFRTLCGVDERAATTSRSLSIAALDKILPRKSSGDMRFRRFLACNV